MRDTHESVFASDVLVGLPSIGEFEGNAFEIAFASQFSQNVAVGVERLTGVITSAEVGVVSELPILPLLGLTLPLLLAARRFC